MQLVAGVIAQKDASAAVAAANSAAACSGTSWWSGAVTVGDAVQISDPYADRLGDNVVPIGARPVLREWRVLASRAEYER